MINLITNYFQSNFSQWLMVAAILVAGIIVIKISDKYLHKIICRSGLDKTLEIFIHRTIKTFLWIILIILILSNLGFDISAFIAGLGVMGFIIGFATKDVLSSLVAGLFILISRPFKIGDTVIIAGVKGVVREITISSCVISTEEKEYVIVPNAKVWGAPIKNLTRGKK